MTHSLREEGDADSTSTEAGSAVTASNKTHHVAPEASDAREDSSDPAGDSVAAAPLADRSSGVVTATTATALGATGDATMSVEAPPLDVVAEAEAAPPSADELERRQKEQEEAEEKEKKAKEEAQEKEKKEKEEAKEREAKKEQKIIELTALMVQVGHLPC